MMFASRKLSILVSGISVSTGVSVGNEHAQQIHFRDITKQAGIHFTHNDGAFGKKWLPETMGPGCAFIDYDNDGYPDILLVNGTISPDILTLEPPRQSSTTTIATAPSPM